MNTESKGRPAGRPIPTGYAALREDIESFRDVFPGDSHDWSWVQTTCGKFLAKLDGLAERATELERERDESLRGNWKQEPTDEGGSGKEETYWLRNKLRSAVVHLRDVEDYYRVRGGTPESFNMLRADRARSLYEQISEDFLNGKRDVPTMRQRAERAEAALREQGEPIMDARFRDRLLRHDLSNQEVGDLVNAIESREALARRAAHGE